MRLVLQILMNVQLLPWSVMRILYAAIPLDLISAVAKQDSLVTENRAQVKINERLSYVKAVSS